MCINNQKSDAQCGNPFFNPEQQARDRQAEMDEKLMKVADATRDLCRALKNVDNAYRQ